MTTADMPAPITAAGPSTSRLVELIRSRPIGDDHFEAPHHDDWLGAFAHGGLVASQALWATGQTVPRDLRVNSMHAIFIAVARSSEPVQVRVERLRDGRSFATRSAAVLQNDRLILHLVSSFHRDEPGPEYQLSMDDGVPPPEALAPSGHPLTMRLRDLRRIELREIGPTRARADGTFRATRRGWVRVDRPLPDDPLLHACALTVVSDVGTVMAARHPIMRGIGWASVGAASLDHTMWFHRPIRADEWMLYELQSVSSQRARSLVRGTMHGRDGTLGVSVVQEVLIRPPTAAHPGGESRR